MRLQRSGGLLVIGLSLSAATSPAGQDPIRTAVETYVAGNRDRAVGALNARALTAGDLINELNAWSTAAGTTAEPRRRIIAAAFALDAVWTATRPLPSNQGWLTVGSGARGERAPLHSGGSQGFVAAWAVRQLPSAGAITAAERALWLAAVGIAQDGVAWTELHSTILPLARARLGDDPRLRLATALARTSMDLGTLRWRSAPLRRRADVLREEQLRADVVGRIPRAIKALEQLLADESLAGEVELRIGYLELRRRRWPDALARFAAARQKTIEPILLATADYFAGWVHEQRDEPEAAVAAYRRALKRFPTMRNLATQLSALLFLQNEREEAYAILDRALKARPIPLDLLTSFERADARFVDEWLTAVRQGIRELSGS
jgi:hypothetical protein